MLEKKTSTDENSQMYKWVERDWCAKIVGSSEKFRFERKFIKGITTKNDLKRFNLKYEENSIYECCENSGTFNEHRTYYCCQNSSIKEISQWAVERAFPTKQVTIFDLFKIQNEGTTF